MSIRRGDSTIRKVMIDTTCGRLVALVFVFVCVVVEFVDSDCKV